MKRCPLCKKEYADKTFNFCLDDGEWLVGAEEFSEQATAVLPPSGASAAVTRSFHDSEAGEGPSRAAPGVRSPVANRTLAAVIIGVVFFAAAGYAGHWYYAAPGSRKINAIAVMPFANASGNPDVEYLSDGITETLIGSLSRIPDLSVKSRSSVFRYKNKESDAQTIGRELGVQAILTGRVVERDQNLTLYIELVDAATENSLWQRTYNRPMASVVSLQSEIARDIAEHLRAELSGAAKNQVARSYTDSPEAYSLYLLGKFHWAKRTKADAYKAIDHYRQAVAKDPNYALAYAGLADVYAALQSYDATVAPREAVETARTYAMRAVSIDDSLSEAHVSLGVITYSVDFDFAGAERSFKRAIELDPKNFSAYQSFGYLLMALGRFEESEANYLKALSIEPTSANANRGYSLLLMVRGRYEESENQLRKTLDLDPNFQIAYLSLANSFMLQRRYADSVEHYAKAREIAGRQDIADAMRASFARGGWRGFVLDLERNDWLGDLRPQFIEAARLASIGENKMALDKLERSYEEREGFFVLLNVDPRMEPLHGEPRFTELLRKVGFAPTTYGDSRGS